MSVSATEAFALCEKTGLSPDLCRLALERSRVSNETAEAILKRWNIREIGSSNLSQKEASTFGYITTATSQDVLAAAVVQASCSSAALIESKEFREFVQKSADEIAWYEDYYMTQSDQSLLEKTFSTNITIKASRFEKDRQFALITTYNHRGLIGTIIETEVENKEAFDHKDFKIFSFDLALHIAAHNPFAISKDVMSEEMKMKLTNKIENELLKMGKSLFLWPEITKGKLGKWGEQNSLLGQIFIKSDRDTVEEVRKKVSERIGSEIKINRFMRHSV